MKKTTLILCILATSLAACSQSKTEGQNKTTTDQTEVAASQPADSTTNIQTQLPTSAQTASDWVGVYKGTIPCADCEGVKIELQLNQDKTYQLSRLYIGVKGGNDKMIEKGSFTFDSKDPSIITLDTASYNHKLTIGENYVAFREAATGEEMTGPLADLNKLSKEK